MEPGPGHRLAPVSFGTLLEISVRLLRRHARVFLLLAALFLLAPSLIAAAAGLVLFQALVPFFPRPGLGPAITADPAQLRALTDAVLGLLAVSVLSAIFAAMAATAFSLVVASDYRGDPVRARETLTGAVRRAPRAVGSMLLSLVAVLGLCAGAAAAVALIVAVFGRDATGGGLGVFLALVVAVAFVAAILVITIRWSLALPAVAIERAGPLKSLVRSWRLTRGGAWRAFGILAVATLATAVLGGLVSELLGLTLADLIFGDRSGEALVMRSVLSALVSVVFAPVVPVCLTVLYYDQRVRLEGVEVSQTGV